MPRGVGDMVTMTTMTSETNRNVLAIDEKVKKGPTETPLASRPPITKTTTKGPKATVCDQETTISLGC